MTVPIPACFPNIAAGSSLAPPAISFEFFPPKTLELEARLWQAVLALAPYHPSFVSVTYGAGGSTRERTHAIVSRMRRETRLEPAAHLTCVGASRGEIDEIARAYWDAGIRHIVALRGDPPQGTTHYTPHPEGYAYAADLVAGLKKIANFEISVAAYPETHPEALSPEADLENLKRKLDAGADRAITQFFFESDAFLRFRDKAAAAGINAPVVPGLLPIGNFAQACRFADMCGTKVPDWLKQLFESVVPDGALHTHLAACVIAEQAIRLRMEGVEQFHIYTLNRSELAQTVCRLLGIKSHKYSASE